MIARRRLRVAPVHHLRVRSPGSTPSRPTSTRRPASTAPAPWQTYRRVTLPLLRPALLVASVLNIIYVFNSFPIVWTLNDRNPGFAHDTMITFMYKLAFKSAEQDVGMAAAPGVFNVLLILVAVVVYLRAVRWREEEADGHRLAGPTRVPAHAVPGAGRLAAARRWVCRSPACSWRWRSCRPTSSCCSLRCGPSSDVVQTAATLLPRVWQLVDVSRCSRDDRFLNWLKTSLLVATASTRDRGRWWRSPRRTSPRASASRGRIAFLFLVLVTQMFSPTSLVVGLYREFFELGLVNTYPALILTNAAFNLAFAIWILHGFFASIPQGGRGGRRSRRLRPARHAAAHHAAADAARDRDRGHLRLHRRVERVRRRADPDARRRQEAADGRASRPT